MEYWKLIELLNEYEPWNLPITKISGQWIDLVISKRYWFIEWLVENDKIDIEKLESLNFNDVLYLRTVYYWMLMLLSIQDNPIEFLVSILK